MKYRREFIGEALGTFVLVLFGCGAVAVSVLFGAHHGLMQVASVQTAMMFGEFYARVHWTDRDLDHLSARAADPDRPESGARSGSTPGGMAHRLGRDGIEPAARRRCQCAHERMQTAG